MSKISEPPPVDQWGSSPPGRYPQGWRAFELVVAAIVFSALSACTTSRSDDLGAAANLADAQEACGEFTAAQDAADAGETDAVLEHVEKMGSAIGKTDQYALQSEMKKWISAATAGDADTAQLHAAVIQAGCDTLLG